MTPSHRMKPVYRFIFWLVLYTSQLISLSLMAWHLSAKINFAYPIGYTLLNLQEHIGEFAPINRHKRDFEFTSPEDHWRLFGAICTSIQDHGRGLADITYKLQNGETTSLLHRNEIIHLQDVANLIDKFYFVGSIGFVLWMFGLALIYFCKLTFPSIKKVIIGFLSIICILALIIISIGSTDVFYWFHIKIFPEGHQWFFYYQDSLMTTLMKAPDIFAFIAIVLMVQLIIFWCGFTYFLNRVTSVRSKNYKIT